MRHTIPFKKDADTNIANNYKCEFSHPFIIINHLNIDVKIYQNLVEYYDSENNDHRLIIDQLDFTKILKPAYIYDSGLNIFGLIDNEHIVILNFNDNIKHFNQEELKLELLSLLLNRLRHYKLLPNFNKLLLRFGIKLVLPCAKNKIFLHTSDVTVNKLKDLLSTKKLIIHDITLPDDIYLSVNNNKDYIDSKSSLTLNKTIVNKYIRCFIKHNIIFNNYKIDGDFKKKRFKSIVLDNVIYINTISKYIKTNSEIINNMFNSLYNTIGVKYRFSIKNKKQFELLKIMVLSFKEYIDHKYNEKCDEYRNDLIQYINNVKSFKLPTNSKLKRNKTGSIIFNFDGLVFNYYLKSKFHYKLTDNDKQIKDIITSISTYKQINKIEVENINNFNFLLFSIIVLKLKNSEKQFEQIIDYNGQYLAEKINSL